MRRREPAPCLHQPSTRACAPRQPGPRPRCDRAGNYQPLNVRYSGERCCVCDIDSDFDFDQMVTCDCCGIAVHQARRGRAAYNPPLHAR